MPGAVVLPLADAAAVPGLLRRLQQGAERGQGEECERGQDAVDGAAQRAVLAQGDTRQDVDPGGSGVAGHRGGDRVFVQACPVGEAGAVVAAEAGPDDQEQQHRRGA